MLLYSRQAENQLLMYISSCGCAKHVIIMHKKMLRTMPHWQWWERKKEIITRWNHLRNVLLMIHNGLCKAFPNLLQSNDDNNDSHHYCTCTCTHLYK